MKAGQGTCTGRGRERTEESSSDDGEGPGSLVRHPGLLRLGLPDIYYCSTMFTRERAVVHGLERQGKGTFVLSLRLLLLVKERETGGMAYYMIGAVLTPGDQPDQSDYQHLTPTFGNFITKKKPIYLQTHDELLYARHPQRNIISTRTCKHINVYGQRELAVVIRHRWTTNAQHNTHLHIVLHYVPFVSSPSCPTTGGDSDSQFSESNSGLIRRSRSSTKRR
jgi:hypothetical protein